MAGRRLAVGKDDPTTVEREIKVGARGGSVQPARFLRR